MTTMQRNLKRKLNADVVNLQGVIESENCTWIQDVSRRPICRRYEVIRKDLGIPKALRRGQDINVGQRPKDRS